MKNYVAGIMTGVVFFVLFVFPETVSCQNTAGISVEESTVCLGIEEREPVGAGVEFPADTGRVYFWTNLEVENPPAKVRHAWYYGNEKKAEVELSVRFPRTRTWSYKTIPPSWTGDWRIDVVLEDGTVLKTVKFKIVE